MSAALLAAPGPPDFAFDWDALDEAFDWVRDMRGCEQNPRHHAEGDVWIHTQMVLESLCADPDYRALPPPQRDIVFMAALLHDVAKPESTVLVDGQPSSPGHSARGEHRTRVLLWRLGVPLRVREHVCALVRYHQLPFFLIDRDDAERRLHYVSQRVSPSLLTILARADGSGRRCADQPRILDQVALFRALAEEQRCLTTPRRFGSPASRFEYFRHADRDPSYTVFEQYRCRMRLLSALPGTGKDHWLTTHALDEPVVSLDDLRDELGVSPSENQGRVAREAKERAREHLRRGADFTWNATNLSAQRRQALVDLATDYGARVEIVYLEVSPETLAARNEGRARPVPPDAIEGMLQRWQVPDPTEAHRVSWNGAEAGWEET